MQDSHRYNALNNLIDRSKQNGYVLFDEIVDICDQFDLPIKEVDWVSEQISIMNIIVRDELPTDQSNSDGFLDYSQSDYDDVYNQIIKINPDLTDYIIHIKSILPPQYKEFINLKYQIFEGNTYARTRCIEMYMRNVLRFALRRYEMYGEPIEDYITDGMIGLINAVDKYNPGNSRPFGSYAALWITNIIQRFQSTNNPLIYYPVHIKEEFFRAYEEVINLGFDNKLDSIDDLIQIVRQVAFEKGISQEIESAFYPSISLDEMIDSENGENWTINHRLAYDCTLMEENLEYDELRENIKIALSELTLREQDVIKMRYGFYENKLYTLEEIGVKYGVTRERIRQIEEKALKKLRHPSRKKYYGR